MLSSLSAKTTRHKSKECGGMLSNGFFGSQPTVVRLRMRPQISLGSNCVDGLWRLIVIFPFFMLAEENENLGDRLGAGSSPPRRRR
jgi:hypothetical protein